MKAWRFMQITKEIRQTYAKFRAAWDAAWEIVHWASRNSKPLCSGLDVPSQLYL
jgi:hypothetical protein